MTKKGLFEAVVEEINAEMAARLQAIIDAAETVWEGFLDQSVAWIEMALDREIRRIMLLDGPAVLGDPSQWPCRSACFDYTKRSIGILVKDGTAKDIDPDSAARLISGAALSASLWIASAANPRDASAKAIDSFVTLITGLLRESRNSPVGKARRQARQA